jgi:hypothetical protein
MIKTTPNLNKYTNSQSCAKQPTAQKKADCRLRTVDEKWIAISQDISLWGAFDQDMEFNQTVAPKVAGAQALTY